MSIANDIFKKLKFVSYVGIFANLLLTIVKFYVGIVGNSEALIADGFNSLSDIFAGLVVYISFKVSNKPQDKDHPYGHAKAEMIATFIVSLIFFLFGFSVITISALKIYFRQFQRPAFDTLIVALVTIIIKEILYKWTLRWGKLLKSTGLIATAYDHQSDVIVSVAVVIGILFAIEGYPYMDPVAGIIVSFFIFRLAVKLIRESIGNLMDESPPGSIVDKINDTIVSVEGVERITNIKVRESGPYLYIDVEIEVNQNMTVKMSHNIAENVKNSLMASNPYINNVMVHINPSK
ncbi:cation diffusion facilitator family transporter [Candidatus Acidulodesulfobacterium sp. H_13]|uniref:cation diffusion facilitator family transporter n=1 Tax=Candidatus Acidulodesulfobacterium sp. H_13 TaxID=3395470 RepID=UPI003AF9006E